jgi:hypothetical protein
MVSVESFINFMGISEYILAIQETMTLLNGGISSAFSSASAVYKLKIFQE